MASLEEVKTNGERSESADLQISTVGHGHGNRPVKHRIDEMAAQHAL